MNTSVNSEVYDDHFTTKFRTICARNLIIPSMQRVGRPYCPANFHEQMRATNRVSEKEKFSKVASQYHYDKHAKWSCYHILDPPLVMHVL